MEGYAEALATSTGREVAELRDRAAVEYTQYLPEGLDSAGHSLLTVLDGDGVPVGQLWLGPDRRDADGVFVFDIEIAADARGRGFGRGAMLAAEEFAAENGRTSIGLNVFGPNVAARRLYDSLDYQVVSTSMIKKLTPTD